MRYLLLSLFLCSIVLIMTGCHDAVHAPAALPTVLKTRVWPISGTAAAAQIARVTDTTIVLQRDAPAYQVGDVLVSDAGEYGFLRRVTGITENADGTLTLATAPAALTDVFQSVELHTQFDLDAGDVQAFQPLARGVTMTAAPGGRADVSLLTMELVYDTPLNASGTLAVQGKVGVKLKVNFDLVIKDGKMQAVQMVVEAGANASLALNAKGEIKSLQTHLEKDLAQIKISRLTVLVPTPVGVPIPIAFHFNMTPYIYEEGDFTTSVTTTLAKLEGSLAVKAGVRVDRDDLASGITDGALTAPALTGLLPDLAKIDPADDVAMKTLMNVLLNTNLEFKASHRLGIGANFTCKVYDAAGPYVKLALVEHETSTALTISATEPNITLDSLVRCKPLQQAGVNLTLFGRSKEASVDMSTIPAAFELHLPLFPKTIPLTGQVESTIQ
jgi:hypothetical protein